MRDRRGRGRGSSDRGRRGVHGGVIYRQLALAGDAAGHVKVSTVGGIVTGFLGALGIVETVLQGGSSQALRTLRRELDLHRLCLGRPRYLFLGLRALLPAG